MNNIIHCCDHHSFKINLTKTKTILTRSKKKIKIDYRLSEQVQSLFLLYPERDVSHFLHFVIVLATSRLAASPAFFDCIMISRNHTIRKQLHAG